MESRVDGGGVGGGVGGLRGECRHAWPMRGRQWKPLPASHILICSPAITLTTYSLFRAHYLSTQEQEAILPVSGVF